ncbi:MAG: hypothetical protein ACR2O1_08630 [Boseongicola sp.]
MNTQSIVRIGAVGMVISGAALGYSYISHPHHMTPEVIASQSWFVIHFLFAVSLVLGLMGTTALYAPTAERAGWTGLIGFCTLFVGMMMIFGLDYYEVLIAPFLSVNYPDVIRDHGAGDAMGPVAFAFPAAGVLTVVGYAVVAFAWMRAQVLPKTVAIAMILSSIAFGIGLSPIGSLTVARVTAAAFGASLVAIGVTALIRLRSSSSVAWV